MFKIFTQLLDLIYKKRCYFCGNSKENTFMCSICRKKIKFLPPKTLRYIESVPVYCCSVYEKELQKLIRGIKYHNQKELAVFQAQIMFDYWKNLDICEKQFVLVPVPLYPDREKKRKYNHMYLVAQEFSKLTGYEVNSEVIKRVKNTKPQYKLTKKQRERNLDKAFECNSNYNGESLLLLDDIVTTGSTMEEMVKTLKKSGVQDVTIFTTTCSELNLF